MPGPRVDEVLEQLHDFTSSGVHGGAVAGVAVDEDERAQPLRERRSTAA